MLNVLRKIKAYFFSKNYKSEIEYWNYRARKYGARSVFHLGHSEDELEKITQFQKAFLFPKLEILLTGSEKTILDFGCGVGRFSAPLAKISNCKVIAVDPIEHLIKMAPKDDDVEYQVIQEGEKIKFCFLKIPNLAQSNIISTPGSLPKELDLLQYIDYDTQFEKSFIDPLQTILNVLGWHTEKRATLDAFF